MKTVSYLRVSGKGQIDGDGFPRQREAVAAFAHNKGFEIVDEYRDEGVSGTNELADRPALAAMIDRLETNGVRYVLVESMDRIARDLIVGELILMQLRDLGITVYDSHGTDLTGNQDPTAKLIRQVLGAVAEYDKHVTVLKLKAARDRIRRENGRCEGVKPYGDKPGEARTLERIRELRRKKAKHPRMSYSRIADALNYEGRPTRTGAKWAAQTVRQIVWRCFPTLA